MSKEPENVRQRTQLEQADAMMDDVHQRLERWSHCIKSISHGVSTLGRRLCDY